MHLIVEQEKKQDLYAAPTLQLQAVPCLGTNYSFNFDTALAQGVGCLSSKLTFLAASFHPSYDVCISSFGDCGNVLCVTRGRYFPIIGLEFYGPQKLGLIKHTPQLTQLGHLG